LQGYKVPESPAGIEYKLSIQVPKGIKNAIELDKINGKKSLKEAIKTELKQLRDYQKFKLLDSWENIPTGYQKIPYHMMFNVKYDLRHKARLVTGYNWNVNDKEDIYSGIVCIDAVRIGFLRRIVWTFMLYMWNQKCLLTRNNKRESLYNFWT
jgi:hypothetical protein